MDTKNIIKAKNLVKCDISTDKISPKVLKSYLFTQYENFPEGYKLRERYVYDYELEFFTYSKGYMTIDNEKYPVKKGDIVFRRPGQHTQGVMPYNCYFICFDLLGSTDKNPETYDIYKPNTFQNFYLNKIIDNIPTIFSPASYEKYHELFESILKEFINPRDCSEMVLKSGVIKILYELYNDSRNPFISGQQYSYYYPAIKKVIDYIKDNIGTKLDLTVFADISGYSPNYFHRIFTKAIGITPNEYVIRIRLDKAREFLAKTNTPITEVAFKCGFENTPYFSYVFKKNLNISPGEFRKRHSNI